MLISAVDLGLTECGFHFWSKLWCGKLLLNGILGFKADRVEALSGCLDVFNRYYNKNIKNNTAIYRRKHQKIKTNVLWFDG